MKITLITPKYNIYAILYWFVFFGFFFYIFDKIKEIALKIPRNKSIKWISMYIHDLFSHKLNFKSWQLYKKITIYILYVF